MNHDKTSTTEDTIQLPTFAVRKIEDRMITRCIGTFTLKLNSDTQSTDNFKIGYFVNDLLNVPEIAREII